MPVFPGQGGPASVVGSQFVELGQSESGAQLVDAVVVAQIDDIVGMGVAVVAVPGQAGHAMGAQQAHFFSQIVAVRDEHAALAGGEVLVGEEAEAADVTPGAEVATVQPGPGGVGGVFDDGQVVAPGNVEDLGHAAGIAAVVDDQDGFGARGNAAARSTRVRC